MPPIFYNIIKVFIFFVAVIGLSMLLDSLNFSDRDVTGGECVNIHIGNSPAIDGQIFNVRADGRYTVYYKTNYIHSVVLKRNQFTVVPCIKNVENQ